ncbi:unnamed protein product [Dracunculus medinensis]|uniref:AraC family transcriptional regulator n=1 Tax=Dracunculus medinensis TaxID=318479 RepID=A0A0N4UG98_DRAME|nr:unnamed protein product [Dracunculus medinensis]
MESCWHVLTELTCERLERLEAPEAGHFWRTKGGDLFLLKLFLRRKNSVLAGQVLSWIVIEIASTQFDQQVSRHYGFSFYLVMANHQNLKLDWSCELIDSLVPISPSAKMAIPVVNEVS